MQPTIKAEGQKKGYTNEPPKTPKPKNPPPAQKPSENQPKKPSSDKKN